MSVGVWLVRLALLGGVAALVAALHPGTRAGAAPRRLAMASALLMAGALVWLASRFLVADVGIEYVHLYTHRDLPLHWRLAGTWTGREGSLLLWSTWASLVAAVFAWRRRGHPHVLAGILALTIPLQAALLWNSASPFLAHDPFAPTPAWLLEGRPDGTGLNPTLRSGFILIHPPMMFLAYALTAVPAAGALVGMVRRDTTWTSVTLPWSRVCWWFYTAAIGLGSMWAYVTLNFGGYWAWDPVEVANLLPWIALTAFLHAQVRHVHHGSLADAVPILAVLPLLLTLFSTFSTRSGLWVSVHAFTDPANTFRDDPGGRLLDILAADSTLLPYAALILALPAVALGLWMRTLSARHGTAGRVTRPATALFGAWAGLALVSPLPATALLLQTGATLGLGHVGYGLLAVGTLAVLLAALPLLLAPEDAPRRSRLGHGTLAATAVTLLMAGLLVLWLFHMAAIRGWSQAFYESRFPWIAWPGVLALILFQSRNRGIRTAWRAAAGAAALSLLAALLAAAYDHHPAGMGLLAAAILLVAVAADNIRRMLPAPQGARMALLAAGVLDVLFWVDPPSALGLPLAARAFLLAAAVATLWLALYAAAGHPRVPARPVAIAAALLGGFLIALPLGAWAAWRIGGPTTLRRATQALRTTALHGIHFGVALLLVGYGTSTYLRDTAEGTTDAPLEAGGVTLVAADVRPATTDGLFVDRLALHGTVTRQGQHQETPPAILSWEAPIGAHVPEPAILRLWDRDVTLALDAVDVRSTECFADGSIAAYAPSERICRSDAFGPATVRMTVLPGMDLLWGGLLLLLAAMALHLRHAQPRRPAPTANGPQTF